MCVCNSQFCVLCIVYLSGEVLCACMFIHIVYCTKHLTECVETDLVNFISVVFLCCNVLHKDQSGLYQIFRKVTQFVKNGYMMSSV